jgi:hypothetical protein
MTVKLPAQLPDDIEQKLMDGRRLRATHDLMERRGIPLNKTRELVGRWLFARQQTWCETGAGRLTQMSLNFAWGLMVNASSVHWRRSSACT